MTNQAWAAWQRSASQLGRWRPSLPNSSPVAAMPRRGSKCAPNSSYTHPPGCGLSPSAGCLPCWLSAPARPAAHVTGMGQETVGRLDMAAGHRWRWHALRATVAHHINGAYWEPLPAPSEQPCMRHACTCPHHMWAAMHASRAGGCHHDQGQVALR